MRPTLLLMCCLACGSSGSDLDRRIDEAAARIAADTTVSEWADYEISPAHFDMATSTGEAVLIADDFEEGAHPQLLRYRNRLLGFYRIAGDQLEPQDLSVHLPKPLGDALISFAGPEFIPSTRLAPIGEAAGSAYAKVPLLFMGHGGVVFSHLVELTPEQPLVVVHFVGLTAVLPSLCERVDDETLAAAATHFSKLAASLREVMRKHNVRFVNASFGDTAQTIAEDWARTCGGAPPDPQALLHLYDPIYDALFDTEGVLTAQASANLGDPAEFPFDQPFPNRVRAGFFSSLSSGLDESGRGALREADQFPAHESDADVFVNWDCDPFAGCADPHYELAGPFGLSSGAMPVMSTSYVTPLALGRLINLRYANHRDEPMSNALIQQLKQELTPPLCANGACKFQDPLAHRQLEVYRQGYR
jgi:hypothetical protein